MVNMDTSFDELAIKGVKKWGPQIKGECQVKDVFFFLMKVIYYLLMRKK